MGQGNPIPTRSRDLVGARDGGYCVRCGLPARPAQWHHRRGKRVKDEHQHAPCNGITLCGTCHPWVHAHPKQAEEWGWIVSRHADPCSTPVFVTGLGWRDLGHDGEITTTEEKP